MSQQRDSGLVALQQGNIPMAISLLESACQTAPNDYLAFQYLGMAYQQAGKSQEAMQTLTRAVHLNPNDAQARYNLGVAMESAGFPTEASQVYAQALQIQPVYPLASQAVARLSASFPAQAPTAAYSTTNTQPVSSGVQPLNAPQFPAQAYTPQTTSPAATTSYTPLNAPSSGIPLNAPTAYSAPRQPAYGAPAATVQPSQAMYGAPGGPGPSGYSRPSGPTCDECGSTDNVRDVHYRQNIGAVYLRFSKEMGGEMCEGCASKYFWQMTLTTMFLGWAGVISFFMSPFFIFSNIASYIGGAKPAGKIMAALLAIIYVSLLGGVVYLAVNSKSSDTPNYQYQRGN